MRHTELASLENVSGGNLRKAKDKSERTSAFHFDCCHSATDEVCGVIQS